MASPPRPSTQKLRSVSDLEVIQGTFWRATLGLHPCEQYLRAFQVACRVQVRPTPVPRPLVVYANHARNHGNASYGLAMHGLLVITAVQRPLTAAQISFRPVQDTLSTVIDAKHRSSN